MLSNDQLEGIKSIYAARALMRSIAVRNAKLHAAAAPSQIFELQRQGSQCYYFLPVDPNTRHLPPVEGAFLFVILADDPGRIYCGVPEDSAAAVDARFRVKGHTSISYRRDVLFAGELFFERAQLMSWTNASGHYVPDRSFRGTNLIPAVQRLLPDDRFADYWSMPTAQIRHHLALRGYAWPL